MVYTFISLFLIYPLLGFSMNESPFHSNQLMLSVVHRSLTNLSLKVIGHENQQRASNNAVQANF